MFEKRTLDAPGRSRIQMFVETNLLLDDGTYRQPQSFSILHDISASSLEPRPKGGSAISGDVRTRLETSG
jgi:hypothetical protein